MGGVSGGSYAETRCEVSEISAAFQRSTTRLVCRWGDSFCRYWRRGILFFRQLVSHRLGQVVQEIQEGAVGPSEADDVHVISGGYRSFRRAGHGIVFFAK